MSECKVICIANSKGGVGKTTIPIPNDVLEPMINRAKFHGIIEDSMSEEEITGSLPDYTNYSKNADAILDSIDSEHVIDKKVALENAFGYLFAKAMEAEFNYREKELENGWTPIVSFSADDACDGILGTVIAAERLNLLEENRQLGKQFYKDYDIYCQLKGVTDDNRKKVLVQAMIFTQRLGQLGADYILKIES